MSARKPGEVYAVVSGSYSDYSVHAIFGSKTEAQSVCDSMNAVKDRAYGDAYEVEEFEFWPAGQPPKVHEEWRAQFVVHVGEPLGEPDWVQGEAYFGTRRKQSSGDINWPVNRIGAWACSWSKERAIKNARDRAAQVLAEANEQRDADSGGAA